MLLALTTHCTNFYRYFITMFICHQVGINSNPKHGRGVAIPHARIPDLNRPVAVFVRLEAPVAFDAADGMAVDLVFGLLSPEQAGAAHLHALAAISRMMRDEQMHTALSEAPGAEALYALLANVIDRDAA